MRGKSAEFPFYFLGRPSPFGKKHVLFIISRKHPHRR